MVTSKIDRETYKRNKIKELMSLDTESDNEWFEENNLLIQNENKTENESLSPENKGENSLDLINDIDNFDFNDTLSSRLDAFQEKINAMLAEGNKMLNQSVTRDNVDLPYFSSENRRRHRQHSHNKQKVAFLNDTIESDGNSDVSSNSQLNSSNNSFSLDDNKTKRLSTSTKKTTESPSKSKTNNKYDKSKKSTTDSNRRLSGKDMLQDAISFSKLVLNNDKSKTSELKNKRSNSPNPSIVTEDKTNNNAKPSNSKNVSSKDNDTIDTLLTQSLNDGESILKTNEIELLRIELKELKEKNKQLQKENMNLKIKNSSLTERQKQQEQQIEKLKQKNNQLQRLLSESNSNSNLSTPVNSRPTSPYVETGSQDMSLYSPSTDSDWNNVTLSPTHINSKFNTISKINNTNDILGSDDNDEKAINSIKKIRNIKNKDNRRFSFPQKFNSSNTIDNIDYNINNIPLKNDQHNRTRSNSNVSFYHSLPKNKSLLHSENNKRHSMFADIRSYDKFIEGWKQIENNKDSSNSNNRNLNENKTLDINSNKNIIENQKSDIMISNNNNNNKSNTNININNTKTNNKRYSFVYPSNSDKTRRYSYLSDISPLGEIKYDVNEYIDKLNGPEVAIKKTRVRKISESYANDLRHRENILKHCSLSPPKFKYSDMKDLDLMAEYNDSISSIEHPEPKIEKAHKRKSILDQISYIRIDDESINNIKNQVHRMSISRTHPIDTYNSSFDSGSQMSNNSSDHGSLMYDRSSNSSRTQSTQNSDKFEIKHLNNRLSIFKNQIQNVQKDLTEMLECEKRIQDLLLPIDNSQN